MNRINIIFYRSDHQGASVSPGCIRKVHLLSVPIAAAYGVMALMMAQMYFGSWGELSRIYYYDPYIQALNYAHTIDCDAYYIYPDPQGIDAGATLGEILTMYTHQIDAHYYQGISNVQDGVELRPYKERYHYENVTAEIIAANEASGERVVYIVDSGQRAVRSGSMRSLLSMTGLCGKRPIEILIFVDSYVKIAFLLPYVVQ